MQTELEFLIALQQHDIVVDDLRQQIESIVPQIQAKNKEIEGLKDRLKQSKDRLSTHLKKRKELELDVDSKEQLVKKHQAELNSLKSNDAYKAMLGEIDAAKKAQAQIEDQILVLMESADAEDKAYKEAEKKLKTDEAAIRVQIQELESKKTGVEAEHKKKLEERDAFAATGPAPLKAQYETIRDKRGGVAIVALNNNSCGGCRMNLPPAKVNEVKKAKMMVLCESCSRIIYAPPAANAAAVQPAPSVPTN